ncbi:Hypothetical protein SRAE_X000191700 [Strongyloides ratti]|uniref:Uncharacterized protein n=1 Tax=Strongyloides ratti TaxID=34506 RepID=A0A090MPX9_STRRB|nr:Hypothetical protein SRAE_X000191700 [Strongyloides ratti]CEF60177.1 Hypothetical protein SRAE_X000191700 [Strongyloides ratti]
MHFIKYFLVFALFAIQLSVQKPNYADVITYEAYGSPGGHGYKDETTFNLLGSDGTRGSAGETTYEYVAGPAPTFDKSSKGIKTKLIKYIFPENCSNVLDCALKSGVADAGKEFLENNLGDSYEVKRKKVEIVYLIVYLVAKNVVLTRNKAAMKNLKTIEKVKVDLTQMKMKHYQRKNHLVVTLP